MQRLERLEQHTRVSRSFEDAFDAFAAALLVQLHVGHATTQLEHHAALD